MQPAPPTWYTIAPAWRSRAPRTTSPLPLSAASSTGSCGAAGAAAAAAGAAGGVKKSSRGAAAAAAGAAAADAAAGAPRSRPPASRRMGKVGVERDGGVAGKGHCGTDPFRAGQGVGPRVRAAHMFLKPPRLQA